MRVCDRNLSVRVLRWSIMEIEARDARIPPRDEQLAREIVSPYLDAALVSLPESGHEPIADFALYRGADHIGWLEVTTATDQATRTLFGQLELLGHKLTTDRLRYDWFLLLKPTFNLRTVDRERLFDALWVRELDLAHYPTGYRKRSHPESDAILDKYDVARAGPTNEATGDAVVRLNPTGQMHWIDPNTINRLVEERFDAKRGQLEGRHGERHLFVLVDVWERSGAAMAMHGYGGNEPDLPTEPPYFPRWVTHVWLLQTVGQPRLWHCSHASGVWTTHTVDPALLVVD